jgi:glycosyltransferase involved in cell wall biosynthesis
MKILFVASSRIPTERAMGVAIMKQCEGFARAGHEVTLVVPRRSGTTSDDPFTYHGVKELFAVHFVWCLELRYKSRFSYYLRQFTFILSLMLFIASQSKDAILYSREPGLLAFLPTTKKKFVELHHLFGIGPFGRSILSRFHGIITITHALKEDVSSRFGYPKDHLHVAPSGVSLEEFKDVESRQTARLRLGISHDKIIALYIGEFDAWKGVETFIDAGPFLIQHNILPVVIGGSLSHIERFKRSHLDTFFLGRRPQSELQHNQQIADVLVIPNSAQYEISARHTSPLKVFSCMASRIPIVASKTTAIMEILNDGNATLVPSDDPKLLGEEIVRMVRERKSSYIKAQHAFIDVAQYDWKLRTTGILTFIQNIQHAPHD